MIELFVNVIPSSVELTRTNVESRESGAALHTSAALIVSPASESTRFTFPHTIIGMSLRTRFARATVLSWYIVCIRAAMRLCIFESSSGRGRLGGRSRHVGSGFVYIDRRTILN